jgi:DNA topoisomerase-1
MRKKTVIHEIHVDPVDSAHAAGLRYVHDDKPGFTRKKKGKGLVFLDLHGKIIRDEHVLQRIHALIIPPAWTDIWICQYANGHLQATGRDARGRKQYRYHPQWRTVRDKNKYDRMIAFGQALPKIRQRTLHDLGLAGMPREKILATVVQLLEKTLIRVGNEEYAKENHSYGLTTLHNRHVHVDGKKVHFRFKGKSGVKHEISLANEKLARIIRKCQELPGHELFEYVDDNGQLCHINSANVNAYLQEITGEEFTAKDFRTWNGTTLAAKALQAFEKYNSQTQAKKNVIAAIESVAKQLGNTRAICRKCYIHPAIIDSYMDGSLLKSWKVEIQGVISEGLRDLKPEEAAVIIFLEEKLPKRY